MFERELEAFDSYSELYASKNPPPVQGVAVSWRDVGFLYVLKIVTVVAAVLLAGFRTAEQFFLSASTEGSLFLGWTEAILAVLAIEGYLVAVAADKARKNKRQTPWLINLGVFLALAISLLAGLGQSFRLLDIAQQEIVSGFKVYLAVGLASASIIALIAGETLGQELAWIDLENERLRKSFDDEMQQWQKSLQTSWDRSKERKAVRSNPQLSESFGNLPSVQAMDWRNLSHEEKMNVSTLTVKQISNNYGVSDRTSRNWRDQAEKYVAEYVYGED